MLKKLVSSLVVFTLTATLFSGCSGKSEPKPTTQTTNTPQATAQPRKPVSLQLSIWGNDTHKKMYEDLIAKYKQKNPNVSAEVTLIPFADYLQKISILKAAGQAPDIAWLADTMIPQFLNANQLMDISKLTSDKDYDFSDIAAGTLAPVTKSGKYYGVAFSTPPTPIYYNKNLFKEKNLQTPMELYKAGKWNYDEFLKAAVAITNKDKGIYGIRMLDNWKTWYYNIVDFVWGFGGDVFSSDGTKFTLNTPEGQQGVQMFYDMMFKSEVHPKPGDLPTFESGKIGIYAASLGYMATAKKITVFDWDIAPLPAGPKNQNVRIGFAAYTMFNLDSDFKADEKLELFKFLTNKDSMAVTAQYFVPCRKSIISSDAFMKLYPANVQENFKVTIVDRLSNAKVPVTPLTYAQLATDGQVYFDMLYSKSISVNDALKQMEAKLSTEMK